MKRILAIIFLSIALLVAVTILVVSLKTPRMDRNWEEESRILPDISIGTSTLSVGNLRDWRYEKGEITGKDYIDETFDLDKIKGVDLLFNPFGQWDGVAHSYFLFKFSDGKSLSISIEARKEDGEVYNAAKGFFNVYELWYAFGTEKDFVDRRAIYYEEELYQYPLLISTSSARMLLVDVSRQAELLETTPGFYNTLTSNCTNLLADSANRAKPGSIPFHYARLFTGFADNHLYDLGYIKNDVPLEQVYKEARVDEKIRASRYEF